MAEQHQLSQQDGVAQSEQQNDGVTQCSPVDVCETCDQKKDSATKSDQVAKKAGASFLKNGYMCFLLSYFFFVLVAIVLYAKLANYRTSDNKISLNYYFMLVACTLAGIHLLVLTTYFVVKRYKKVIADKMISIGTVIALLGFLYIVFCMQLDVGIVQFNLGDSTDNNASFIFWLIIQAIVLFWGFVFVYAQKTCVLRKNERLANNNNKSK